MYSLDVNFLKDRPEIVGAGGGLKIEKKAQPMKLETPLLLGGAVGIALPAIALVLLSLLNWQISKAENTSAQLDAEVADLQTQQANLAALQTEIEQANTEVQSLIQIFDQIKPWSAILQDIRERVPPGVQIESITEGEGETIVVSGFATTFNNVNDFLLTLQRSAFLENDATRIQSAQLVDNPVSLEIPEGEESENIEVALPQVVGYTITTQINDVPASEILQELDRKGAVGLVTRIRTLREQGIIEQ